MTIDRECLFCDGPLPDELRPHAIFCSKSCRVQAAQWRRRQRDFHAAVARIARKPRTRLWLRTRPTKEATSCKSPVGGP